MNNFNNILVAIDTRLESHPILQQAALIAKQNGASVKVVDVVPDFSWTVRWTLPDHEDVRKTLGEDKRQKLAAVVKSLQEQGVEAEAKVLWGKSSVEIIREVLRGKHDLVLRVAKGQQSRDRGFFGATGRRLLRECPSAVWLIPAVECIGFQHVLACVDPSTEHDLDAELNDKVFELATEVSQRHAAELSIIHAWSIGSEQLMQHRMLPEDFERLVNRQRAGIKERMNTFLQAHGASVDADHAYLVKSDPGYAIPEFAREKKVDLVVMGTVARSGLTGMVIGNTAERILEDLECAVLALKPNSFESPITQAEYINPAG
ncbi:MAG: universal stress protein [Fuerstiella sp.]